MAKGYEMEGTLRVIDDIKEFKSGFTKREFVIEAQDGKFPQMIKFECIKDKTSLTDGFNVGDDVKVAFDIRGNEYNGRYYVNLNAWKLERAGGAAADDGEPAPPSHLSEPPPGFEDSEDSIHF